MKKEGPLIPDTSLHSSDKKSSNVEVAEVVIDDAPSTNDFYTTNLLTDLLVYSLIGKHGSIVLNF